MKINTSYRERFLALLSESSFDLLPLLGVSSLLTSHIWIFFSETAWPNEPNLEGSINGRSSIKIAHLVPIYTVRQKLSTTWLVSIISFLIMNLFQIGLLFSLPVHTYLPTCETGYWSIFIYVYMTGCVKCHVYFLTFVFANESWFFWVEF